MRSVKKAKSGHNRYCGPAALSILTGCDTQQAAALLRLVSGKPSIKGCRTTDLLDAVERLGYNSQWSAPRPAGVEHGKVSLAAWLKQTRDSRGSGTYLLVAGHHFAVIEGRRYCCGLTGKPVPFKSIPHRRAQVTEVRKITKVNPVSIKRLLPDPSIKKRVASDRSKARALANKHGIEIDTWDSGSMGVYPPSCLFKTETDDPFYGDHYVYDWEDALERVQEYSKLC